MGQYIVNGEAVDITEPAVTGAVVKERVGSEANDWVMASMPSGEVVRVGDTQSVPTNASSLSVVPAFQYGK